PYSPSSRTYLDYLYIDVTAVTGFADNAAARALAPAAAIAAAREAEYVDYAAVAAVKRPVLEALFRHLEKHDLAASGRSGPARRPISCAAPDRSGAPGRSARWDAGGAASRRLSPH